MHTPPSWDIFCRVIDNHGDLGVCWRLACQLATRGHPVRLWVDDASALAWMAPLGHTGVDVRPWDSTDWPTPAATRPASPPASPDTAPPATCARPPATAHTTTFAPNASVWLEAFGCEPPDEFIANNLYKSSAECQKSSSFLNPPAWINLEYLSAEPYAQRCHRLPSPVMSGPARGLTRHFFYPGFTPGTGGLLREPDLLARQAAFDRAAWLRAQGVPWAGERIVSLFCYEPAALAAQLAQWAAANTPTRLLVAPGRPWAAVCQALAQRPGGARPCTGPTVTWGSLVLHALPHLSQHHFDHLLWASDANFVRGEDSLVRALWAGKPLVWHIYPQDDGAHGAKLNAFLDWLQAPADLRAFHHHWNAGAAPTADLPPVNGAQAAACVQAARARLLAQPDLVTQLLDWLAH